jgi:5,5'-dehydrodivanillate O-demethylase oxygenase subunit
MLTREANERLTATGPGTPMGTLLRCYWHPIATTFELDSEPVLPVRLLGENLVLYRDDDGRLGLVAERCPHRGASLSYGIPEPEGLRCPYHGWLFSAEGRCLEQPAEPPFSTFHNRIRIPAYPVQEMGGLVWAYLGKQPAPLLPRYDLFVEENRERRIGISRVPCNWLQIMENSVDPVHLEYLHGKYTNYVMGRQGRSDVAQVRHHERIAFDVFEHGISKRRLLEGQSEDCDEWRVGHPILFPCILAVGDNSYPRFDIRVPLDDTNTLHYWYEALPRAPGSPEQQHVPAEEWQYLEKNGRMLVETVAGQDIMAWVTQGPNSDRSTERLGTSDKGVILLRTLLNEQMEIVARGGDPLGVIRDPARNTIIEVPREGTALFVAGNFVPSELMASRAELAPSFGRA